MKTEEFNGAKNLLLKVQMSKGKGDLAWQHTQLFRTNLEFLESMFKNYLVVALRS